MVRYWMKIVQYNSHTIFTPGSRNTSVHTSFLEGNKDLLYCMPCMPHFLIT